MKYETKFGIWHIDNPFPKMFAAQHDDITGDGDPYWQFAYGQTLDAVKDEIAAHEDEHGCTECHRLRGEDNITEVGGGIYACDDCLTEMAQSHQDMLEMAADDMAHAARDKAAGL